MKNKKIFEQLYDAMEALVHICRDGCQTIGPYDKVIQKNQMPCKYESCKGLEALFRHLSGCKLRVPGGCKHCKRMWQLLELHSRLCADLDMCRVPLCRWVFCYFCFINSYFFIRSSRYLSHSMLYASLRFSI